MTQFLITRSCHVNVCFVIKVAFYQWVLKFPIRTIVLCIFIIYASVCIVFMAYKIIKIYVKSR